MRKQKASFTPLVYSTAGGMAEQALIFHKKLAYMIAEKTGERYSDIINCMRAKISFAMLRSVLISVRGNRGKIKRTYDVPLASLSFNLIPNINSYECL